MTASRQERGNRLFANEALIREVNDRVELVAERWEPGEPVELLCECSDLQCSARIHLTAEEYRQVRADPTLFLVAPGHIDADVERPIGQAGDAVVVAKNAAAPPA